MSQNIVLIYDLTDYILYTFQGQANYYSIELSCFRLELNKGMSAMSQFNSQ